jgi:putative redox protein
MLEQIACSATVTRVVMAGHSVVLDMGREARLATAAQRRALAVRDLHCRFPSCRRTPRWCDAHHIESWLIGGATDLPNLILLCRRHHTLVHQTRWTITRRSDGTVAFTHPARAPRVLWLWQGGAMRSERITFPNGHGQMLAGRIDYPVSGEPLAYALYAHCFTCNKNLRAIGRITQTLALHGIATLRFDFTGLGESEGDFADTNFTSSVDEYRRAADYLAEHHAAPEVLIGHSLGGAVALAAAPSIASARAVVAIAAPANPEHIKRHIARDLDAIEAEGAADVLVAGRPFTIRQQLIDDVERIDLANDIARLRRPLLVLHSPIDNTVGVENALEILDSAKHPKSFISLDNADHLISVDADARYVAEVICSWANRYTTGDLTAHAQPDFLTDVPRSVTVARTEQGYRTDVVANGFALVADEPTSVGGTNTGPTPYDYLLTALGSCTSMTLRMYADRKEWPLETVTVRLTHHKVHVRDCAQCESEAGFVDHIDREITVTGPLDADQQRRLGEIADRCPVHKTLHGEVVVNNRLILG